MRIQRIQHNNIIHLKHCKGYTFNNATPYDVMAGTYYQTITKDNKTTKKTILEISDGCKIKCDNAGNGEVGDVPKSTYNTVFGRVTLFFDDEFVEFVLATGCANDLD